MLCNLVVDLHPIPFEKKFGPLGYYYEANFEIVVKFGIELWYGLARDGKILGSITAKYI